MREKFATGKAIVSAVESLHDAMDKLRTRSLGFFADNPSVTENHTQHEALQHHFNTGLTALSGDIQLAKRFVSGNTPKALERLKKATTHADELLMRTDAKWKNYTRASQRLEGFDAQAEQFGGMLADLLKLRQRLAGVCELLEGLAPRGPQQGQ